MKYYKLLALTIASLLAGANKAHSQDKNKIPTSIRFEKKMIATESFETVSVFDVDNDGILDIVSGEFWYQGPSYIDRFYIGPVKRHEQYTDDFANIPMDVNGDGNMDYITGGWFNKSLIWRENPGNKGPWKDHIIDITGNVEAARAWDIDNDGFPEIVPNTPNDSLRFYKLERDKNGKGIGRFTKTTVAEKQGHGLGFGDINGDGRGDFIVSGGWIEAPKNVMKERWITHNDFNIKDGSVPMIVTDVNGDGKNDIIVGQAHSYGLDWYEQSGKSGNINWKKHPIDPFNAQFHSMEWVDLDGDGINELVTGKRYRAHNGNDPGGKDLIGLYYFRWNGESFTKQVVSYGTFGEGKGTGVQFTIADLRKNGRKDIIVAGKDGLCIFFNEGK